MTRRLARVLSLGLFGSGLLQPARAGAFENGDLYLLSRALPTVGEGILRIDPESGAAAVPALPSWGAAALVSALAAWAARKRWA